MPEETTRRELRIPLPRAEPQECFLAIPFDGRDDISDAIGQVLADVRVLRKRTDINPKSSADWPQNVVQGIRRADVIIAVINNKKGHRCYINPNVAYEIGIAHALEKPLIIVARDKEEDRKFFKDVSKCLWLDSDRSGDFNRTLFTRDLQIRLTSELTKSFSSETWRDAKIIDHVAPKMGLVVDGYEDARKYGRTVLRTFQDFVRNHLTPLSEAALAFLRYENAIDIKKYTENYKLYQHYYLTTVEPLLKEMSVLKYDIVKTVSSWRHTSLQYHLHKVHDAAFGSSIRDSYTNLENAHENAVVRTAGTNAEENSNLSAGIDEFRKHCTDVISAAGDYLICLVDTLIQINKEQRCD